MSWLEIWAMLKVIGLVICGFLVVSLSIVFLLLGITELISRRKDKQ